jgi:hypothetical protein
MANKNAWEFLIVVALLVFFYYVIREIAPLCKEISVEQKPDGHIKFTALTHEKEEEISDTNPPLVLQGS